MKWSLICLSAILLSDQAYARALDTNAGKESDEVADETNNIGNEIKVTKRTPAKKGSQSKKDADDVLIELDLKETTALDPSAQRYGRRYVKSHEKHVLDSILSPQVIKGSEDGATTKLDLNLQSFLQLVNSLLASQRLNTYADTIGRKAASLYSTLQRHSKKEIVKPQVVEFRSGKPSLVYAFDAGDILQSLDNFLASALVRTYTDKLAKRAGAMLKAVH